MQTWLNRRFLPLFTAQFLGAFNDNLFKNALVILIAFRAASLAGLSSEQLVAAAGGVFILPYVLFSALAGQLADKLAKSSLIRIVKAAELGVMAVGALGFWLESLPLLFVALFLIGTQATFFGPLKYGALPELLPTDALVGGNARIELGTFIAILLGTLAGGVLVSAHGPGFVAIGTLAVAALGYFAARAVPDLQPAAPELRVSAALVRPTIELVRLGLRERSVWNAILGISWFWLVGAVVLSVLPSLVRTQLGGNEAVVTYLLALFSIGIGVGSLICERLSFRQLELGLVPVGSFGISLFLLDAALAVSGTWSGPTRTLGEILDSTQGIRLSVDLSLLAIASGIFTVPLYTLMQERSAPDVRSRVIAANNVMNAVFMVAGSGLLMLLQARGFSVGQIFVVVALMNIAVAVYIYTVIPEFLFRLVCWGLAHVLYRLRIRGRENIPEKGAAVLVCNHITFIDWLVISAATQRPIRFVMHAAFTKMPLTGRIFRDAKVIPIAGAKEDPAILEQAFVRISEELRLGELVCIFPEGALTTDGEMAPFRRGIERIIERDPVAVIPMRLDGLWGSFFSNKDGKALKKPFRRFWSRVQLRIGKPVEAGQATAADLQERVTALAG